ncbi:MAG: hypothetical protein ACRENP_08205 [Longimicrobiales bacterium]
MTWMHLVQLAAAFIAGSTPWCVVRIAAQVASRHARAVDTPFVMPRSVARLGRITVFVLVLVAAAALGLPAPSLAMGLIDGAVFIGLAIVGLRALSEVQDASRPAREVDATIRAATLRSRRLDQYLAWPWRVLPYGAAGLGVATFVWRVALLNSHQRLWLPVACACFSVVFLWLYETWMRSEVAGGRSADLSGDHDRHRRRLQMVFAVELALILVFLGIAHALLDLAWSVHGVLAASLALTGAGFGVVGCALALSSELPRRRYPLVPPEPIE